VSVYSLAYGYVVHHIYKQEAMRHVGIVSFLSFLRSCDRTNVVGESYLTSELLYYSKDASYEE